MNDFNIKVKDVKEFVKTQRFIYASGKGKTFSVALQAGPNVERYVVSTGGEETGFTKLGDAVRFFNGQPSKRK